MEINPNGGNSSKIPKEYTLNMMYGNQLGSINQEFLYQTNPQMNLQNQLNQAQEMPLSNLPPQQIPVVINENDVPPVQPMTQPQRGNNVYHHTTSSQLYSISFQNSNICRLAVGTLEPNEHNRIEILELINNELTAVTIEEIGFPSTKLLWGPTQSKSNLLASSSDCMRLYHMHDDDNERKLEQVSVLQNKKSKFCGPLTSFDWNKANDAILGTASIDTTCAIWDLNKQTIKTQLIAHDKEVFDISFFNDEHIFISSGADGSIRLFDLRELDHSTIIYETQDRLPITKIAWNMNNKNLISAISFEKEIIYVFDSRIANVSLVEVKIHKSPVTGMVWAPNHETQICSVSEDKNVIITENPFDKNTNNRESYTAPSCINNVSWCQTLPEWIGITLKNNVQLLRK